MSDDFKDIGRRLSQMGHGISTPSMIDIPEIDYAAIERRKNEIAGRYDAEGVFEHLMAKVKAFQSDLDKNHEIGLQLANYGVSAQIHIRSISFQNPNLIEFHGLVDGEKQVTLVQHISQLNFLLIAVPPIEEDQEPYRVGFK